MHLFALLLLVGLVMSPGIAVAVQITEIRLDQPGVDGHEYFELAAPAGTRLDGLTYIVIGDDVGGCGSIESITPLDGLVVPSREHLLVAETETLHPQRLATLNFENNDNVTHLVVQSFTGELGQDLDFDNDGTFDVEPWDRIVDAVAISEGTVASCTADEHLYGERVVGPDGHFAPGHVYLCEGDWRVGDFDFGVDDSPGAANVCRPPRPARTRR